MSSFFKKKGAINTHSACIIPNNYMIFQVLYEKNADQESKKAKRVNNSKSEDGIYPSELHNIELEERYIGLLLDNPKAISMYYIVHEDCYFQSDELLNLYKSILFTEGQAYAPQIAKNDFNFAKESPETYKRKIQLKEKIKKDYHHHHYYFYKNHV
ncbi:MAG: hypothetical protein BHW63_00385 [Mycoplasma sp. CAG:611_25_7]|nr:MAG: hypothetical protein BHW63_00385 [Mycoplasma sp. CAG:611_25_7]